MADATPFSKFVPGFDFLQNLVKGAGAALPNMGQWVAPTLDPAELEKRIDELRTVQFWLEQNAKLLGTTIQALEVQRMTLATLKTMNVQMTDLREAMTIKMPERPAEAPSPSAAGWPMPAAAAPASEPAAAAVQGDETPGPAAAPAGVVDPMQWWGALTRQFTDIAARAMHEAVPAGAVPNAAAAVPVGKTKAAAPKPARSRPAARKAPAKTAARGRSSRS